MKKFNFNFFFAILLILASCSGCVPPCEGCDTPPPPLNSPLYSSTWATLSYGVGDENAVYGVETQYHFFDGDSVFNNNRYAKLYCYKDEQHSTRFYEGLIREDNSKIFFIPKNAYNENLLYDFSLTEGTYFGYSFIVKQVDYVNINGNNVKRIQLSLSALPCSIIDVWYEGIGSVNGFLYPLRPFSEINRLLCYSNSKNNTLVYQNSQFPNCYYDNAEDIDITNHLQGTYWKLAGIYDAQTETLRVLEFTDLKPFSYTLYFESDNIAVGITISDIILVNNILREDKDICRGTEDEMSDEEQLYLDILYNSTGYYCSGSELKLFFGEENNYLLYYYFNQ